MLEMEAMLLLNHFSCNHYDHRKNEIRSREISWNSLGFYIKMWVYRLNTDIFLVWTSLWKRHVVSMLTMALQVAMELRLFAIFMHKFKFLKM